LKKIINPIECWGTRSIIYNIEHSNQKEEEKKRERKRKREREKKIKERERGNT